MKKVKDTNNEMPTDKVSVNKKRKKWLWILLISFVAVITAIAIILTTFVKTTLNYDYQEIEKEPEALGFEEVISEKIINIALFGVDTRNLNSFKGLSDSIIILSVNEKTKKVKLISVMRDSFVPISHNGATSYSKINSAYSRGGPTLAVKTLNTIFGLDISEYATVNFSGMADIVDAVGGIDATITKNEIWYINAGVREICSKRGQKSDPYLISDYGTVHLNGVQAVAYARIRYTANIEGTSNDYGRTDRQRYILEQLFNKAKTLNIETLIKLLKTLTPCCETSVSYTEALDLIVNVLLRSPTMEETRIPDTSYTMRAPKTNAGSVVYYDLNFAAKLIHNFIYEDIDPKDYIATNGIDQNNWYATGYVPPNFEQEEDGAVSSDTSNGDNNTDGTVSNTQ